MLTIRKEAYLSISKTSLVAGKRRNIHVAMSKIREGIMAPDRIAKWNAIIQRKEKDDWSSCIARNNPVDVKLILVSPHSPSPAQLQSLPRSNTSKSGVFA